MKHLVPGTSASLLSWPSKMSCASWSLPAGGPACPSLNGSICAGCYAVKGRYRMNNVVAAQQARWQWTASSMQDLHAAAVWVQTMTSAIIDEVLLSKRPKYFRIHDSGDFFSPVYAISWLEVIRRVNAYAAAHNLEPVKFWAPTRRWQAACRRRTSGVQATSEGTLFKILTDDDRMSRALTALASEPYVTIRPSALDFDAPAPVIAGLAAGSGSVTTAAAIPGARLCPASVNSSSCAAEQCRSCWEAKGREIYYMKH